MTRSKKKRSSTRRRKGASKTHELTTAVKIIGVIGCILILVESIFRILATFDLAPYPLYTVGVLQAFGILVAGVIVIIFSVINIVIAILILAGFGVIDTEKYLAANFLMLLIFGIIVVILGAIFGGACLIIAAILDIIGLLLR